MQLVSSLVLLLLVPAAVPTGEWKNVKSEEGKFSIRFPGQPRASKQTVPTAAGPLTVYTLSLEVEKNNGQTAYLVTYNEMPPAKDVEAALDAARDATVKPLKAKIVSETKLSLGGLPGREFVCAGKVRGQDAVMHNRVFLAEGRLYQLRVVAVGDARAKTDDIQTFLESFALPKQ